MTSLRTASGMKIVEMRSKNYALNLDLSSIVPPRSEDGVAKEEATLIQEEAPTESEIVQVEDATLE